MPGITRHHYHDLFAGKFYDIDVIPCNDHDCDRDHRYVGTVNDYTDTIAAVFDNVAAFGGGAEHNGRVYYVTAIDYHDHRGSGGTPGADE